MTDYYLEALASAKKIYEKKTNDYDNSLSKDDYWIYGYKSLIHEINKKVLRLRSLESIGFDNKCESATDTCLDLINYTAFLYEMLRKENES